MVTKSVKLNFEAVSETLFNDCRRINHKKTLTNRDVQVEIKNKENKLNMNENNREKSLINRRKN